jgi:hypothetical protein
VTQKVNSPKSLSALAFYERFSCDAVSEMPHHQAKRPRASRHLRILCWLYGFSM